VFPGDIAQLLLFHQRFREQKLCQNCQHFRGWRQVISTMIVGIRMDNREDAPRHNLRWLFDQADLLRASYETSQVWHAPCFLRRELDAALDNIGKRYGVE
jgi:hypothetical protein